MLPRFLTFTSLTLSAAATAAPAVFERDEAHFCKPKTVTTTVFQPTTVYMTAGAPPSTPSISAVHPPKPISESYHPQSSTVIPPSAPTTPVVSMTLKPTTEPTIPAPAPSPSPSSPSSPVTPSPGHSGGKYANALYFTNW